MHGEGEDVGAVIEGFLDAVAVVGVEVEEGDPRVFFQESETAKDRVVDVAESGGFAGEGVVEAAGEIESDIGLGGIEGVGGREGGAGGPSPDFEEVREDGGVGLAQAHMESLEGEVAGGGALELVEVGRLVEPFEFRAVGGGGRHLEMSGRMEEVEAVDPSAGARGAFGFEGAVRGIMESLHGGCVDQGELSLGHGW
jgi:hypothetical protein